MDNPYRPTAVAASTATLQSGRVRYLLSAIALLCGLGIALSGIDRFISYGGFATLVSMSPPERGISALWAATHVTGITAALVVSAGLFRKSTPTLVLGIAIFVAVCTFAWAWPMDFLWFA